MLAVLIAALAHDVPEEDTALSRIDEVVERLSKHAEGRRNLLGRLSRVGSHLNTPSSIPHSFKINTHLGGSPPSAERGMIWEKGRTAPLAGTARIT